MPTWSQLRAGAAPAVSEWGSSFPNPSQREGCLAGLALPGCFFPGQLLTFQPAPALLHLSREVAHCLEEADALTTCGAPGHSPAFSPFTPFMGLFNFHDVALFVG